MLQAGLGLPAEEIGQPAQGAALPALVLAQGADPALVHQAGSVDGERAGASLSHLIKSLIGVTADVRVVSPGGIQRSLGKAKRVVDKRPKG